MASLHFPDDFLWGTATASFQVEGAGREDGRSESIWDRFCRTPGKVYRGDNGEVACDHYHRYAEDVALMAQAGVKAYRFSIAWPRIVPDGVGKPNPAGIAFYKRLLASLRDAGIQPVATLYHWDLPQVLEDAGGWTNRATATAFAEYARVCFTEFGDDVKMWTTLNEPLCSAYMGYRWGAHAPGIADDAAAYRAVHHLNLAHGLAVKIYRSLGQGGKIGIVWNLVTPRAATRREEDRIAAERVIADQTRVFTDPVFGRGYPALTYQDGTRVDFPVEAGDLDSISAPIDFIGLNYYTERPIAGDRSDPRGLRQLDSYERVTDTDWPVVPEGLVRQLRWITAESGGKLPLYIMENGCAERDVPTGEAGRRRVHDPERVDYLRRHLAACSAAISEGIPLAGYFVWSFIDNFEWAHGYTKRFGIVYCDYATLERIPKDSFYFYRDVIAGYVGEE